MYKNNGYRIQNVNQGYTKCTTCIVSKNAVITEDNGLATIYKNNGFVMAGENNVGADIFHRGLCLPSDNKMTAEQQDMIIEIVKSCFA